MARPTLILAALAGFGFLALLEPEGAGTEVSPRAAPSSATAALDAGAVPAPGDGAPSASRNGRQTGAPLARPAGRAAAGGALTEAQTPLSSAAPLTATVSATSLRLRASPSTGGAVLGSAGQGARVAVLGEAGAWLEVRLASGTRGWMHGDYLSEPEELVLPTDVVGRATVTDGDTIRIRDVRVRLHGIDAPESGQRCEDGGGRLYPCAGRSANALAEKIGRGTVACREEDVDRYGRTVATCVLVSTGEDLNAFMVASGWALAYRRYSDAYVGEEAAAKRSRRGLWQGRFVAPWDYRGGERLERLAPRTGNNAAAAPSAAPARVAPASGPCRIKGNISDNGRIYHVPGSRWYERTVISPGKGERWFCSEAEARAAGWRAPRG